MMSLPSATEGERFEISKELLRAYEATEYRIEMPRGAAIIRIGEVFDSSSSLLAYDHRLAIITAFNPYSQVLESEENCRRQLALAEVVETAGRSWLPAKGVDPSGTWSPEPSLAVFDPTEGELDEWMELFGQNAIVVVIKGRHASLRLNPRAVTVGLVVEESVAAKTLEVQ